MQVIREIIDQHGTPENPLVFDGEGQSLDGEHKAVPLLVRDCSWVRVRNFSCCNSSRSVVEFIDNEHSELSEICAWNANATANHKVIHYHGSRWCHIHDCAAWGTGRKIYSGSYGGNYNLIERCWGRWEGSEARGPKIVFAIAYNNFYNVFRDCIGDSWAQQYHLLQGIFGADHMDEDKPANTLVHRCCAISGLGQYAFHGGRVNGLSFVDCVDGTLVRQVTARHQAATIMHLIDVWRTSPILPRLMALAKYADPVADLMKLLTAESL